MTVPDRRGPVKTTPVRITETVLRDAHQSLLATRMRTEDMLPVSMPAQKASPAPTVPLIKDGGRLTAG